MIDIEIMRDNDPLWDKIQPGDKYSIYHTKAWKDLVEETFGHSGFYLRASEDESLLDVVPFFLVKNRFMGKKLVSTPYEAGSGGFSASQAAVREKIVDKILEIASTLNVRYVELRTSAPIRELKIKNFIETNPFVTSEVSLIGLEKNWWMLSRNHRRNVRIAEKRGVSVVPATEWYEMKIFFRILFEHYREMGIPFFGESFFQKIWDQLIQKNFATLLIAKHEDSIVGGHLLFFSGNTLISKYSAVKQDAEISKLNASYALFWEGILLGLKKGFRKFYLGVTSESNEGLLDFKSRFGSETRLIYFYYFSRKGNIPDFAKYYGEYAALKSMWALIPAVISSRVGQKINEWIC